MLLAVPLTVMLKVVLEQVPVTRLFARLLGKIPPRRGNRGCGDRERSPPMTDPKNVDTAEYAPPADPLVRFFGPSPPAVRVDIGALSHPGKVRPNNEDHYGVVRRSRSRRILATNVPEGVLLPAEDEE